MKTVLISVVAAVLFFVFAGWISNWQAWDQKAVDAVAIFSALSGVLVAHIVR